MDLAMKRVLITVLLVAMGGSVFLLMREDQLARRQFAGNTMGGRWSVQVIDIDRPDLAQQVQQILDDVESKMSTWRADSEVSRFNASRSIDWFSVSEQLVEVVHVARQINKDTNGAFDITVSALVNLWGFGPRGRMSTPPTDEQIDVARQQVGTDKLTVRASPPALRKSDPDLNIDLSAIAKGFAADRVAAHLDGLGIANYLITVGGENRAKGVSRTGHPWHIGIETPTPDVMRIIEKVELRDCAVSTSGDYRNYVEINGQRYSHAIDPRTGRPINHDLASVTVIDRRGARADALATGLMVLGPEEGLAAAKRLKLPAMFIRRARGKFEIHKTAEFESYIVH